jgi:Raf kinase inhibitor-like YbhB/YbcL family protein
LVKIYFIALIIIFGCAACQAPSVDVESGEEVDMQLKLTSAVFSEGQVIPEKYTCDGEDLSVPLSWSGVPLETKSLVLIADDPDAPGGTFVHWVLYDLPADQVSLKEGMEDIGTQGENGFRKLGYNGPCPPQGPAHRYFFKIYALDTTLNLPQGATKAEVEEAMQGHILADGQLMGTYQR